MDLSPPRPGSSSPDERTRHESPRRKRDPSPDSASKRRTPTGSSFPTGSPSNFPTNSLTPPSFTTPPYGASGSGTLGSASSSRDPSPTRPDSQPTYMQDLRESHGHLIGQSSSSRLTLGGGHDDGRSSRDYDFHSLRDRERNRDRERMERIERIERLRDIRRLNNEQGDVHQRIATWTIVNELNNQPLDRADSYEEDLMARFQRHRHFHASLRPPPGWNETTLRTPPGWGEAAPRPQQPRPQQPLGAEPASDPTPTSSFEQRAGSLSRPSRAEYVSPLDTMRSAPFREAMFAARSRGSPTGSSATYDSVGSSGSSSGLPDLGDPISRLRSGVDTPRRMADPYSPYSAHSSGSVSGPSGPGSSSSVPTEPNWDISQVYQRRTSQTTPASQDIGSSSLSPGHPFRSQATSDRDRFGFGAQEQSSLFRSQREAQQQQYQHQHRHAAMLAAHNNPYARYTGSAAADRLAAFERRYGYGAPEEEASGSSSSTAAPAPASETQRFGDIASRALRRPYASYGSYTANVLNGGAGPSSGGAGGSRSGSGSGSGSSSRSATTAAQAQDPYTLLQNRLSNAAYMAEELATLRRYSRPRMSGWMLPNRIGSDLTDAEKTAQTRAVYNFIHQLDDGEKRRLAANVLKTTTFTGLQAHAAAPEALIVTAGMGEVLAQSPRSRDAAYAGRDGKCDGVHWDAEVEGACAVCQDDYEPESDVALTPCKHMYHASCLASWLKTKAASTCPMCRRDMASFGMLRRMCDSREMALELWIGVADEGGRQGWF